MGTTGKVKKEEGKRKLEKEREVELRMGQK
jgi:hypothetical protein